MSDNLFALRHNKSGLYVKTASMYGSCVDVMEADGFTTPEEAIAACPLPVGDYSVVNVKTAKRNNWSPLTEVREVTIL